MRRKQAYRYICRGTLNKTRVVIASRGCHNVIYFSIISNFYTSMSPVYANFDIFRLYYILLHSIGQELVYIDPFLANVSILYLLKTPENSNYSSVYRSDKMGTMVRNGFIKFIIPRRGPAQKISFLLARCFIRPSEWGEA